MSLLSVGGLVFKILQKKNILEAKKVWGGLCFSFSNLSYLKMRKNHLLIEIPGSVESQVATALSPDVMLKRFGKKVAHTYTRSLKVDKLT
jgi:hypothetical protein